MHPRRRWRAGSEVPNSAGARPPLSPQTRDAKSGAQTGSGDTATGLDPGGREGEADLRPLSSDPRRRDGELTRRPHAERADRPDTEGDAVEKGDNPARAEADEVPHEERREHQRDEQDHERATPLRCVERCGDDRRAGERLDLGASGDPRVVLLVQVDGDRVHRLHVRGNEPSLCGAARRPATEHRRHLQHGLVRCLLDLVTVGRARGRGGGDDSARNMAVG